MNKSFTAMKIHHHQPGRFPDTSEEAIKMLYSLTTEWCEHWKQWERSWKNITHCFMDSQSSNPIDCCDEKDIVNLCNAFNHLERFHFCQGLLCIFQSDPEYSRHNARFSQEENEKMLSLVTDEEYDAETIALCLGRSINSVQIQMSRLFGKERESKPVDGIFIGKQTSNEKGQTEVIGRVYKRNIANGR